MNPQTLLELFVQPEFLKGLAVGGVAAAAVVLVPRLGWFQTWTVAAVAGLLWAGRLGWSPFTVWWSVPAAAVAALFAGTGAENLARRGRTWPVPVLFAFSVLGVWGTVPDTERAAVLMGATVGTLAALSIRPRVRIGWVGAILAAAVVGYVVVTDGALRGGAIVGGLGTLGMLIVAPAVVALAPISQPSARWLLATHVLHVVVSGRVAGGMRDPVLALFVVASSALVTGAALWWGSRRSS